MTVRCAERALGLRVRRAGHMTCSALICCVTLGKQPNLSGLYL